MHQCNLRFTFDTSNSKELFFTKILTFTIMKTIIIHHVNEGFTEERIETITMRGGAISVLNKSGKTIFNL